MRHALSVVILALNCRAAHDETSAPPASTPRRGEPALTPTAPTSAPPATPAAPALPPLANLDWIEKLELADGDTAYVTPPLGATEPRPLIVAVHGAGDRPEWACGGWRLAAQGYAFVVCPQGVKMDAQRFAWDGETTIARRVEAALAAVRARFGAYLAEGPPLYAGFSQGATLASAALLERPSRFPVVLLAEGAYQLIRDDTFLRRLQKNGTRRVALVCGSPACFRTAEAAAPRLRRHALEPLLAGDPRSGHNLNQLMQDALHQAWPSFVADLPGWQGYAAHAARGVKAER